MNHQRYIRSAMLGIVAVAALAAFGIPVLAVLPFLVVLACPLMMVFMMRGMGHGSAADASSHGSHRSAASPPPGDQAAADTPTNTHWN